MAIKSRNKVSADFSMASMTDIVFLLLIFFMLTSTLVTTNAIDILTPNTSPKKSDKPTLKVFVDGNLNYSVDNKGVSKESLESRLVSALGHSENKVIVLGFDKTVPIENTVYVMNIANKNGIKVVLAAQNIR